MIGIKAKRYCYVCSPYRGNIFMRIRNRRYARELTERAINAGFTPITPHLYINTEEDCGECSTHQNIKGLQLQYEEMKRRLEKAAMEVTA